MVIRSEVDWKRDGGGYEEDMGDSVKWKRKTSVVDFK